MKVLLAALEYEKQQRKISRNLNVISLLQGLQSGYTKHMSFLCFWNSRADAEYYMRKDWLTRPRDASGSFNCAHTPLLDPEQIFLLPLHLKLGLAKDFIKVVDNSDDESVHLSQKLYGVVSEAESSCLEGTTDSYTS